MKILYCVNLFPSTTQTFVLTQMREMHRRGHTVTVYALRRDPGAATHATLPVTSFCDEVCYAPVLPDSKARRLARALRTALGADRNLLREATRPSVFGARHACSLRRILNAIDLAGAVERLRPDVVHVHFATNAEAPLCCRRAGCLGGAGLVVTFHGYDLEQAASFYPALFASADLFTANSDYTLGLATAMGCPAERARRVPMGIDLEVFKPSASGRDDVPASILFVGRFVDQKGPDLALHAFARLRRMIDRPCTLTLIGEGPMREDLGRLAGDLEIAEAVRFAGPLPQEQVREAMAGASIFLLPGRVGANGRQENQGVVIQEAQAMELPVVASNTGGVGEGLDDGRTGFLVPAGDVEATATRLKALVEDPELRLQMGRRGRALVEERFNCATLAGDVETMYRSL